MTQARIQEFITKAKEATERITASKQEARNFLNKGGFCTQKGYLTKDYRSK